MSISYEEALETLQSMFGEKWTRDDLDTVLRHHQGHMENTVDMILRHGDGSPESLLDQIEQGIDPRAQTTEADEQLARQLSQSGRTPSGVPGSKTKGRGTPTILPDDFLRLPNGQRFSSSSNAMSDDEALARMLQDQMFTEEVSRNPELAHLARGRPRTSGGMPTGGRAARSTQQQQQPEVDLMKSLGNLGNNAKRHLQNMAAQFNAKVQATQNKFAGGAGAAADPQPTSGGAHERRGLLDGEDDDEVALEIPSRKDL